MNDRKDKESVPLKKWRVFVDDLSAGTEHKEALFDAGVTPEQFESTLRTSAERQLEYEEARTHAIRSRWTSAQLENVMDSIIRGDKDGSLEKIVGKKEHVSFLRLIERDPSIGAMYAEARLLWAEKKVDDLVKIINTEDKMDKTKFDAAKWLMAAMNDKFSTAKKATKDIGNATELEAKLEAGRQRVEDLWAEREAEGQGTSVFG